MTSFKDNAGRTWELSINVSVLKKLKTQLGIDIKTLTADGFAGLRELLADPIAVIDAVYVVVKPMADAEKVTEESFGNAMSGDAMAAAADALREAVLDYLPDREVREAGRTLFAKARESHAVLMAEAGKRIAAFDPEAMAREIIAQAEAEQKAKAS